jgi:battenin
VYLLGGVLLYRIPYVPRVLAASILSSVSLAFAATARSSGAALAGMAICSVASGLGEVTFLALTSRAPAGALAAWGSGTGFAGIAGAGLWVFLHDVLGYSTKATLLLCSPLPLLQGVAFMSGVRRSVAREGRAVQKKMAVLPTPVRLQVLRQIVVPFMLPLFVVYMFEYSINQALFLPLGITAYRSRPQRACKMYSMLQLGYQVGVFISRTSLFYVKFPYPGLMAGGCYVNGMHQMTKLLPAPHQEFALSVVAVANTGGILVAGIVATGLEEALLRHLRAPPFEC